MVERVLEKIQVLDILVLFYVNIRLGVASVDLRVCLLFATIYTKNSSIGLWLEFGT